jgi:hypothetical protein
MFDGNIKGNMELNNLKLHEIRQDISTRRLAKWVTDTNQKNLQVADGYGIENDEQPKYKTVVQQVKQIVLATAQLLVK